MPAYLVANITVHDPSQFSRYVADAPPIVARFGGRYIIRAGASEVLEGNPQINRTVVIEFPAMQNIKDFYGSPEYQALVALRATCADTHLFCIEGFGGHVAQ